MTMLAAAVVDLLRSRRSLLAEVALLRHQVAILQRSVARPRVTRLDRIVLVALAALTPTWRNALRIVQPETLLRWHRAGFRALWRWRSRPRSAKRLPAETGALIRSMASNNSTWGAERIRGELLKLGIKVSKRTIQRYIRAARPGRPHGQRWSTFLRNHAREVWACDFLQAYDVFFRAIFVFVFIELASRRIVFAATTRAPSQPWVTQQLRKATPFGEAPKFLIRDRDDKFGPNFDAVARASGIRVLRTAMRAPNMNAICERFLGSLRRECLDHVIVLDDVHLHASSRSTSATTTPLGRTKGSASGSRCPRTAPRPPLALQWKEKSSNSRCSAACTTTIAGPPDLRDRPLDPSSSQHGSDPSSMTSSRGSSDTAPFWPPRAGCSLHHRFCLEEPNASDEVPRRSTTKPTS